MAFQDLSEKLQNIFAKLRNRGVLTEEDIEVAMREIRLALLEADVNFKVVKEFVAAVKEKALGEEVMKSLTPGQQIVKIVHEELIDLMGSTNSRLTYSPKGFTVIMMIGLQGAGKTTTCGKLALYLKKNGKNPMMAACDVYRPAAIDQLEIVGESVGVPVFTMPGEKDPETIAKEACKKAQYSGHNILILDTSGRLHIDEELMDELKRIKKATAPHEILLVLDAMTGQDAVNASSGFDEAIGIDGIIMTKLDGDARGGAALSVKSATGKPIKFIGVGEKADALEPFYPDRMASRILGMGDVMSLIEKAQEAYDEEQQKEIEKKIRKNEFTLEDFLEQFGQIRKMGGLAKLVGMLPGANTTAISDDEIDRGEKEFKHMEAIICSMTKEERRNPDILNASRRKRISAGCGLPVSKINQLVKRYEETRKMMKQFNKGSKFKKNQMFKNFM